MADSTDRSLISAAQLNRHKVAYRVLLTRARQGMVIFVPPGDDNDATRKPVFYDGTFEYLRGLGVASI